MDSTRVVYMYEMHVCMYRCLEMRREVEIDLEKGEGNRKEIEKGKEAQPS